MSTGRRGLYELRITGPIPRADAPIGPRRRQQAAFWSRILLFARFAAAVA